MLNTLIDVHAAGCAGNYFDGNFPCPKCGGMIQLTILDRTSTGSQIVCSCGQGIEFRWKI
jgi:transcription elongation factor Elf1